MRDMEGFFTRKKREQSHPHPLVSILKGPENTEELSKQVDKVIPGDIVGPPHPKESFDKLFEEYKHSSEEWKKIDTEERIPDAERNENIRRVNQKQEDFLRDRNLFRPESPFMDAEAKKHRALDLYIRLDPEKRMGHMDEFQLAIIAKAVDWYISEGHSRLFDHMRIVPGNRARYIFGGGVPPEMISQAPHLATGKPIEVLNVTGEAFKDSFAFANRFGLTTWNAKEAAERGTTPLITWTTYQDPFIRPLRDIVVFQATFNADDRGGFLPLIPRIAARAGAFLKNPGKGYARTEAAGNISFLIDETFRCLRELEEKEIARVQR